MFITWCSIVSFPVQFGYFDPQKVRSNPEVRTDLFNRELSKVYT